MARYSFLLCPLLLSAALHSQTASAAKSQSAPTFESNVWVVLLDVVVTDPKGNPVPGLTEDDFRVLEDGKPQKVASFKEHKGAGFVEDKLPPMPKNTYTNYPEVETADSINVILMDSLNTPILDQYYVHQHVLKYLKTIPPGARVAIFTLSSRLRMIQDFTTDSTRLLAVLDSVGTAQHSPLMQSDTELESNQSEATNITPTGNEMADMATNPKGLMAEESVGLNEDRVNITLTAFQQLANYLAGFPGRKNLMWVSGAFPIVLFPDADLPAPSRSQHAFMDDVQRISDLCTVAQIAVYPIAAGGLVNDTLHGAGNPQPLAYSTGPDASYVVATIGLGRFARHNTMDTLARNTGGQAFYDTNGIKDVLEHVTNEGMHYYTLTYSPTNTKMDNRYRRTRVELTKGKYNLSYRRGYYATDTKIASGIASTHNPLLPLMSFGLPDIAQLVYKLSVTPSGSKPASSSGNALADFRGPGTHYVFDFAVSMYQLKLELLPDGNRRANLEVRAVAYDDSGKPLNMTGQRGSLNLTPKAFEEALKVGVHLHEELDVPANANVHFRTGVYDMNSGNAGTLGIRMHTEAAGAK